MNKSISETELLELSRTLYTLIPRTDAHVDENAFQYRLVSMRSIQPMLISRRNLEWTFRRVLFTTKSANLSIAHATAAWNCVHGFLDQGIASSVPRIRDLFFGLNVWIEVFDLFLMIGPGNRSKPMKQVIQTLAKVLPRNPNVKTRNCLRIHVINKTVSIIHQPGGSTSIRLVFQILEHFIGKNIISASEIVLQHAEEKCCQDEKSVLNETPELFLRDISSEPIRDPEVPQVEAFLSEVLDWARYPDIASIAGALLVVICKSLANCPSLQDFTSRPPLWTNSVKKALRNEPSFMETMGIHILPNLLKLNLCETKAFLETLPLEALQQGNARDVSPTDIEMTLVTLREGMKIRLMKDSSMTLCDYCFVGSFGVYS